MEESEKIRKRYTIVYKDRQYFIKNYKSYIKTSFTDKKRAEQEITKRVIKALRKRYNTFYARMRKEPNVATRTRKWKNLCRLQSQILALSQQV